MKRTFYALLVSMTLVFYAGCGPIPTPEPPAPPSVPFGAVGLTTTPAAVAGVHMTLGPTSCDTNELGVAYCVPVPTTVTTAQFEIPAGYVAVNELPVHVTESSNTELVLTIISTAPPVPVPVPVPTPVPTLSPVTVAGLRFVENGQTFVYKGFTDFRLYDRYLLGEDISGLLTERAELGANTLRVLGMAHCNEFNSDGSCKVGVMMLHPQDRPEYYAKLKPFALYVAGFGLRIEFVVFADAQVVMPDFGAEAAHLDRVLTSLSGVTNVFIEICNEPFKNIPGGAGTANTLAQRAVGRGFLVATGNYEFPAAGDPVPYAADYLTFHPERKPEWPRTSKDAFDFREVYRRPVISDEPMGADEVNTGSRSAVPDDFAYFAATAALEGAGSTFHSTDGLYSRPLRPISKQSAQAFFNAMNWVPRDAQLWPYQRGEEFGGPGIGNMPMNHTDALALRTFCKGNGGTEWCVAVRPATGWAAIGRDGWVVFAQEGPRGALVRLAR